MMVGVAAPHGSWQPHPGWRAKSGCSGILHLRQGLCKCLRHPCRRSGCRSTLTNSKRTEKLLPEVHPSKCGCLRAPHRTRVCLGFAQATRFLSAVRWGAYRCGCRLDVRSGFTPLPSPKGETWLWCGWVCHFYQQQTGSKEMLTGVFTGSALRLPLPAPC